MSRSMEAGELGAHFWVSTDYTWLPGYMRGRPWRDSRSRWRETGIHHLLVPDPGRFLNREEFIEHCLVSSYHVLGDLHEESHLLCWRGCGEKGTLLYYQWGCKLGQPPWKAVWRFLKKLESSNDLAIPHLDIYPDKTIIWKDTFTPMFIEALFIITKT